MRFGEHVVDREAFGGLAAYKVRYICRGPLMHPGENELGCIKGQDKVMFRWGEKGKRQGNTHLLSQSQTECNLAVRS